MTNFQAADCTPGASSDGQSPSYPVITDRLPTFVPNSIIMGGASTETKNVRTFYYGLSSNPGPGSSMTNFGGETTPHKGETTSDLFGGGRSRLMNAQAVQSDSVNTFGDSFPPESSVAAYKRQHPHSLNQQQQSESRLKGSLDRERMKLAGKTSHAFNQQNSSLSAGVAMQEGASPVTT